MLVDYPCDWWDYMTSPGSRKFKKDTPKEIIEQARKTNAGTMQTSGRNFFDLSLVDEDKDDE